MAEIVKGTHSVHCYICGYRTEFYANANDLPICLKCAREIVRLAEGEGD